MAQRHNVGRWTLVTLVLASRVLAGKEKEDMKIWLTIYLYLPILPIFHGDFP